MADHNQIIEMNSNAEIIQFTLPVTAIQAVYDTSSFYLAEVASLGIYMLTVNFLTCLLSSKQIVFRNGQ